MSDDAKIILLDNIKCRPRFLVLVNGGNGKRTLNQFNNRIAALMRLPRNIVVAARDLY